MTLRHLPRKVCIFENNGNSKKSKFSFYQVSQKTFSARNQIHPTPGTSSNPTSVTYQSSKTKQLLLSSKHAYEDTPRSAHPPPLLQSPGHYSTAQSIQTIPVQKRNLPKRTKQMPNNASTDFGSNSLILEAIHTSLAAHRFLYVPLRSESGTCPATHRFFPGYGARRHPNGERADGLTRYGRLPLAESGFCQS